MIGKRWQLIRIWRKIFSFNNLEALKRASAGDLQKGLNIRSQSHVFPVIKL
jgi:hypothetical protein